VATAATIDSEINANHLRVRAIMVCSSFLIPRTAGLWRAVTQGCGDIVGAAEPTGPRACLVTK
jgi:hypothetical protein